MARVRAHESAVLQEVCLNRATRQTRPCPAWCVRRGGRLGEPSWGVRRRGGSGSVPRPLRERWRHGGNALCMPGSVSGSREASHPWTLGWRDLRGGAVRVGRRQARALEGERDCGGMSGCPWENQSAVVPRVGRVGFEGAAGAPRCLAGSVGTDRRRESRAEAGWDGDRRARPRAPGEFRHKPSP